MYATSQLWQTLINSQSHWFEVSVVIGETGRLIDNVGDAILFGGDAILVGQAGADGGFQGSQIFSLSVERRVFASEQPGVGACISSELKLRMLRPVGEIPRMALVAPFVRVTNGTDYSEWIPQGKYFIDTREYSQNDDGLPTLTIHAYDAILMSEQDYPSTTHAWPMVDTAVVQEIAEALGVGVDPRTWDVMTENYMISAPAGYSMREVLGNVAASYCGNFIANYDGDLLLVIIDSYPPETNYLIDDLGSAITFGGDRILV